MTDYKLVTVEPTPEMVEAAKDAYMPFGDMEMALRMALLAAPAVQGDPAYWLVRNEYEGYMQFHDHPPRDCDISPYGLDEIIPLYVAPQPAPDVARLVEALYAHHESHDARLIAAAPDLLESLQVLLYNYGDTDYCSDEEKESDPDVQQARAAIAKALGESQ